MKGPEGARKDEQQPTPDAAYVDSVNSVFQSGGAFAEYVGAQNVDFNTASDSEKTRLYEAYNQAEVGKFVRENIKGLPKKIQDKVEASGGVDAISDGDLGKIQNDYIKDLKEKIAAKKAAKEQGQQNAQQKKPKEQSPQSEAGKDTGENKRRVDPRVWKGLGVAAVAALGFGVGLGVRNNQANAVESIPTSYATSNTEEAVQDTQENTNNTGTFEAGGNSYKYSFGSHAEAMDRYENLDILGMYNVDGGFANKDNNGPNPDKIVREADGREHGEYKMANFAPTFKEWLKSGENGKRDDSIVIEKIMELAESQPETAAMLRGLLQTSGFENGNADFSYLEKLTEGSQEGYKESIDSLRDFFEHVTGVEPGAAYGKCTNFYMRSNFDGSNLDSTKIDLVKDANWYQEAPADGDYNVMVFTAEKDGKTYKIMVKGECVQGLIGADVEVDVPEVVVDEQAPTPEVTTTRVSETTTVTTESTPYSTTTTTETTNNDGSTTTTSTNVSTSIVSTETSTVTTEVTTQETTHRTSPPDETTTTTTIVTTKVTTKTPEETTVVTTVANKDQERLKESMGDHAKQEQTKEPAQNTPPSVEYNFNPDTGYMTPIDNGAPEMTKETYSEEIIEGAEKIDQNGRDWSEVVVPPAEDVAPIWTVEDNKQQEEENKQKADETPVATKEDVQVRFGRRQS